MQNFGNAKLIGYKICHDRMKNKFAITGLVGAVFAALCCFTPFLTIVLPAIGLGGLMGVIYNDAVLLPALAIFLVIAGYGFWKGKAA